jgi:hypothetical protein
MIPISEKSSGGALVDWVPEGHDRKYTEPAAMSIRIAATPPAWLTLMREARPVSGTPAEYCLVRLFSDMGMIIRDSERHGRH